MSLVYNERTKLLAKAESMSGSAIFFFFVLPFVIAALGWLEHDPEKCAAVFGKDHAPTKSRA